MLSMTIGDAGDCRSPSGFLRPALRAWRLCVKLPNTLSCQCIPARHCARARPQLRRAVVIPRVRQGRRAAAITRCPSSANHAKGGEGHAAIDVWRVGLPRCCVLSKCVLKGMRIAVLGALVCVSLGGLKRRAAGSWGAGRGVRSLSILLLLEGAKDRNE